MYPRMKKKFSSGVATQYITRKRALQKLQISLNCFRKLCIYKGVYPREPSKRKEAQKGQSGYKILYHKKDIQYLFNDDLLWHFRDLSVHYRKMDKARALKQFDKLEQLKKNTPVCSLKKVIKDRYPTVIDALRNLSECLITLADYGTLPSSIKHVDPEDVKLSNRVTMEFMLAVIEARALRHVFVTIEGYYFEIEFMGEKIISVVPHDLPFQRNSVKLVDFKVMSIYAKFYIALLRSTNAYLYKTLNLTYPPKLEEGMETKMKAKTENQDVPDLQEMDKASVLNAKLERESNIEKDEVKPEDFGDFPDDPNMQKIKSELEEIAKLKNLFENLRFFLNREVPVSKLVFIIRCFGGKVSWDESVANGSTFDENDSKITHQIVDRPIIDNHVSSRHYVQPQWLFDSINSRKLLPVYKYCPGAILPPQVYPYTSKDLMRYLSTDEEDTDQMKDDEDSGLYKINEEGEYVNKDDDDDDDNETGYESGSRAMSIADTMETGKTSSDECDDEDDDDDDDAEDDDMKTVTKTNGNSMPTVTVGINRIESSTNARKKLRKQELKLREKMIRRKYKKLYAKMKNSEKLKKAEIKKLKKKRRELK